MTFDSVRAGDQLGTFVGMNAVLLALVAIVLPLARLLVPLITGRAHPQSMELGCAAAQLEHDQLEEAPAGNR